MRVGLRVDVDTLRGTRHGIPALIRGLDRRGARGSFFVSVGPDNMGRHLRRLVRPAFLAKMWRTRAASLYGWDVLLRGTVFPGPPIGRRAACVLRRLAASGHEVGLHAWDHHAWQTRVESMSRRQIADHLRRGIECLQGLTGNAPTCSAAPAWRTTEEVLEQKLAFPFAYNSDCRGREPFLPVLADGTIAQLQVPTTLPTYDEVVGRQVTAAHYYDELLAGLGAEPFAVLTIHAEVEGIVAADLFDRFLARAVAAGHEFVPLGSLAAAATDPPRCRLERREVTGREGWASWQGERVMDGAGATVVAHPASAAAMAGGAG